MKIQYSLAGALALTVFLASGCGGDAPSSSPSLTVNENPTPDQIAAAKPYLLDTCLVSGEKLGSMGDPPVIVVGDQQVKLYCGGCMDDLKANAAKLLAKLK